MKSFRDILFEVNDMETVTCAPHSTVIKGTFKDSLKIRYFLDFCFIISPSVPKLYNPNNPRNFDKLEKWLKEIPLKMNVRENFGYTRVGKYGYIACPSFSQQEKNGDKGEILVLPDRQVLLAIKDRKIRDHRFDIYTLDDFSKDGWGVLLSDVRKANL